MNSIIIYNSLTGFTKKYAYWLQEAISADIYDVNYLDPSALKRYDTIIFGGSLQAVGIIGLKDIKPHLMSLINKNIIVYAVGASEGTPETINKVLSENFSEEEHQKISFHYLRGGFDFNKLSLKNKLLMRLFRRKLLKVKNKTPEILDMIQAFIEPVDFTSKENIKNIVDACK